MPDEPGGYSLVVPFLTNDPKFTLGWECGMLYQQLAARPDELAATVHADNDEQILVMAGRLGYACELAPLAEGWVTVRLTRRA